MDGVVVDEGVGGAIDEVEGLARLGLELAEELLVGPGRDGRGEQQRGEGAVVPGVVMGGIARVAGLHTARCHHAHPIDLHAVGHATILPLAGEGVPHAGLDARLVHELGGAGDCVLEVARPLCTV